MRTVSALELARLIDKKSRLEKYVAENKEAYEKAKEAVEYKNSAGPEATKHFKVIADCQFAAYELQRVNKRVDGYESEVRRTAIREKLEETHPLVSRRWTSAPNKFEKESKALVYKAIDVVKDSVKDVVSKVFRI